MILTYRITILHYIYHNPLNQSMIYFITSIYYVMTCRDIVLLFNTAHNNKSTFKLFVYNYFTMRKNWLVNNTTDTNIQSYHTRCILLLPKAIFIQYYVIPNIHQYDTIDIDNDILMIQYSYSFILFIYCYIDLFSELVLLPYPYISLYINSYVFDNNTINNHGKQIIRPFWPYLFSPLFCTSIYDFWSYKWHQMTSDSFKHIVYKPVRYITNSRAFALISILLFSGIFHQIALYYTTFNYYDYTQILFFTLHGIICAVELQLQQLLPNRSQYVPTLFKIVYFHCVMSVTSLILFKPFAQQHWSQHLPHSILPF